jgi:hypothetical protein
MKNKEKFKSKTESATSWIKKKIEQSFKKDLGYKETNVWLTNDGQPDVMVECYDKNNNKKIYRFSIIATQCLK